MLKKGLFLILFSVLAFSVFGRGIGDKIRQSRYTIESNDAGDKTISILKYTGLPKGKITRKGVHKPVRIPDNFDITRPLNTPPPVVGTIGKDAFAFKKLVSVILPRSVTTIGDWSFSNNALTIVAIPGTVVVIGDGAFAFNLLENISLPPGASVGNLAFYNNKITRITGAGGTSSSNTSGNTNRATAAGAPSAEQSRTSGVRNVIGNNTSSTTTSIIEIGEYAFADNLLTEVTIGNNVSVIGDWALYNNELQSVTIGARVTSIGEGAFSGNQLTRVVIPPSVTSIGKYAFAGNTGLNKVTIGDDVSLGDWAFDYDFAADYYGKYRRQGGTYNYDEEKGSWIPE
jgi:acetyltransferase-like isoleucine patch superfamily enzyme